MQPHETRLFSADLCVPSTMLPAIMARWMLLFTERDEDVIALFRAAPRRYFRPSPSSPAMILDRGPTNYGRVSASLHVLPMAENANCSQSALLNLTLDLHGRGYVNHAGGLKVEMRLRASSECGAHRTLSSVTVSGDLGPKYSVALDAASETATLHLATAPARGRYALEVHALFAAE